MYEHGIERAIDHSRVFIAAWTDPDDGTQQFLIEVRGDEFSAEEAHAFAAMIRDQQEWLDAKKGAST